jgi:undecaprenyl-diphosphatase
MEDFFKAAVLGIVQGLTEFLPISSSAHLILVPWLFGWKTSGLTFDVALHLGTSVAILAYFWRDWVDLARELLKGIRERSLLGNPQRRLAWFLIVGTLPAMVVGLLLEDYVESTLRSPLIPVVTLVGFGLLLYYADRKGHQTRSLEQFNWGDSLWIGVSQAVALIPGVSRSGITISAARLRDASRTAAARFSFLLSTPIIVGAGALQGLHLISRTLHPASAGVAPTADAAAPVQWGVLIVGIIAAAITGFLCIRFFLRYLQTNNLVPFVIYRIILAAIVLLMFLKT